MKDSNKTTRVQRAVALALTLAFIPMIFGFGIYSLVTGRETIAKSVRYSYARHFLAEDEDKYEFFPMLTARIQSLQNQLGEHIPLKDELGYVNADFQYGVGKDLIMAGSQQLLSLEGGQLYNMTTRKTLAPQAEEIVALNEAIGGETPFLFSYINPQFYEGSIQLPAGYDVLDTGDELADEVLGILRGAGIEALDSREFLANTGYTDDELFLRTDMHWTTLAGLLAAQRYAEEINRMTGAELDVSKLALEQFETELHPQLFLGEYGQQVGAQNAGLDDITLYWPKYETDMTRRTVDRYGEETSAEGSFREAVIKWDTLENEPDGTNVRAYAAYGLVERIEELVNRGDCADMTLLMFRDSYSAPVGAFLSLLVKNVVMVDMRSVTDATAMDFVEQYDPDMVIVSFSRQMMEDHAYTLN